MSLRRTQRQSSLKGHETAHSAGKLKSDDVFASLAAITDAGLLTVLILALLLIVVGPVHAEPKPPPFTEDVMIVFDASGFMVGNLDQGIATLQPRIDEVRSALAEILPTVTHLRRVRPHNPWSGPRSTVRVHLDLKPMQTPRASSCAY